MLELANIPLEVYGNLIGPLQESTNKYLTVTKLLRLCCGFSASARCARAYAGKFGDGNSKHK